MHTFPVIQTFHRRHARLKGGIFLVLGVADGSEGAESGQTDLPAPGPVPDALRLGGQVRHSAPPFPNIAQERPGMSELTFGAPFQTSVQRRPGKPGHGWQVFSALPSGQQQNLLRRPPQVAVRHQEVRPSNPLSAGVRKPSSSFTHSLLCICLQT